MAEFRGDPDDLRELIRYRQLIDFKREAPYPIGAFLACVLFAKIYEPIAFVSLGMCLAWLIPIFLNYRNIKSAYLWRYAWLQEDVTVEILEDGISIINQRGSSFLRWDGDMAVRPFPNCFILEEEGEDMIVLPKKYFNTNELLMLQNQANKKS